MNAFLALSVDKLSEVRDLEEDESKENENQEKERKEREEQLSALKHPKDQVSKGLLMTGEQWGNSLSSGEQGVNSSPSFAKLE